MKNAQTGLSEVQAAERLAVEGPNALAHGKKRSGFVILREVLREPMLLLLLVGGGIYLLFGDRYEAAILLVFATFSVLVTVVQESRTERMLEALRDLTSPRALVIRDGLRRRIAGRDVVRGDLIVLCEGDRVPADAQLTHAEELRVDESLLTGEALAVRKRAVVASDDTQAVRPGGDDSPLVFAGSLITRGSGLAEVVAIGAQSQIGKIGVSLASLDTEPPRLRVQTARLVRIFGMLGAAVAVLAVLLYGFLRGDWLEAGLAGIALGMAMMPEEFPVVLTVFMAMGAWRISQARVLTRRAASIESLGAATVLCTDKTGTLTQNRMTVQDLRGADGPVQGEALREVALCGLLASAPHPFDPMDTAFHDLAARAGASVTGLTLRKTFGLRPDLLVVTQVWHDGSERQIIAAKGAPEAIASLCQLPDAARDGLQTEVNAMAARGLRVLGLALARLPMGQTLNHPRDVTFDLVGLAGLADPLRDSVPGAVRECLAAGIRVVMITGDYPITARSIATAAGLTNGGEMSGEDIATLDDAALQAAVADTVIFARVMPEQKLRIVMALKARGEIVAMTGDGVNDAPSLKAAHIGIAMGGRGTDVAREAASIVLLDDDFGSIVQAIRLGRRIYDNLRKAMGFILAVHLPIAGIALLPLALGLPIVFGPVHIAFIEMIIDPVCSLVFEAETEEDDLMRRPPRDPQGALFSRGLILWSLLQGIAALAVVAGIYLYGVAALMPEAELRALTFFTLVAVIVSLIYVNRSFSASPLRAFTRPNLALLAVPLLVGAGLALVLLWPFAAGIFGFGSLHADDIALPLAAVLGLFLGLEVVKALTLRWVRQ